MRRLERARVRALDDDHAWIIAQTPVELTVTDVEGNDSGRAALQEHVGKAAGRGADVERLATVHRDAKRIECVRQLDSAATDIGMVRLLERDFRIFGHRRAGFLHRLCR